MISRRQSYLRRNKFDEPFAGRVIRMLESPAYRVLSLSAHRVLARIEIELKRHGGKDNGKLPITYEQFVEYGIHRHAIAPAIRECEMLGFLEAERGKAGNREYRAPSTYRLTYQPVGRARPTHDWQRIQTLKDAKAMARAARKTPARDSENQCRKAPVFGAGNHHLKAAFSVPDSVTTVPVPSSVTTSRLSGSISTAKQERAASERGTVVGCASSEATGDGKGTRLTEEATALTEDRRQSSMLGTDTAPDDGIPEFLRRKAKGAAGDRPRDAGGMASDRTIAEEEEGKCTLGLRIESMGDTLFVRGPKRAEAVVKLLAEHKAEVLAALSPSIGSWWRERFAAKAVQWFLGDRNWEAAKRLAWGDSENEWHYQHGKRWPTWQCAGCDALLGGSQALNLPDGNRVHLEPIDCLIRFGKRWRGDASKALIALGLEPPGLGRDQL